jgi:hypothetical protein
MFTAAASITGPSADNSNVYCLMMDSGTGYAKCSVYTVDYYLIIKRNEVLTSPTNIKLNLKNIILCEKARHKRALTV